MTLVGVGGGSGGKPAADACGGAQSGLDSVAQVAGSSGSVSVSTASSSSSAAVRRSSFDAEGDGAVVVTVTVGDGGFDAVGKGGNVAAKVVVGSNPVSTRTTLVSKHNHLVSIAWLQMVVAIALWYLFSLMGLYLNKYAISTLHIDLSVLSTVQVLSTFIFGAVHVGLLRCYDHHCGGGSPPVVAIVPLSSMASSRFKTKHLKVYIYVDQKSNS